MNARAAIAAATRSAADWLTRLEPRLRGEGRGRYIVERDLQDALALGLEGAVVERKCPVPIPRWDPQPGNLDLWVRGADDLPQLVVETKLKDSNKVYECLWDLAKLVPLHDLPHVQGTFLVAGFLESYWTRPAQAAELFETGRHELAGSIERYRDLWVKEILGDSAGRPAEIPEFVDVERIASVGVRLWGYDCELRAVEVRPQGPWIPLRDGLPAQHTSVSSENA